MSTALGPPLFEVSPRAAARAALFLGIHPLLTPSLVSVARIAGVDIPRDKRIEIALTYVYGIGLTTAQKILAKTGVNPDTRVKDLDDADVQKLRGAAEAYTLEGDLRRQEGMALKRLQDIGCVRGRRHRAGLPVRGQRTRTNARTRRGARKTVAGKKK